MPHTLSYLADDPPGIFADLEAADASVAEWDEFIFKAKVWAAIFAFVVVLPVLLVLTGFAVWDAVDPHSFHCEMSPACGRAAAWHPGFKNFAADEAACQRCFDVH